jgi:tetratricopeptide (TPR) repeat protein
MIRKRWVIGVTLMVALGGAWVARHPMKLRADDTTDGVKFSDLDQKLFDARRAFKERRFDVAITTCEKILQKNPDQLDALKIMGSGYYMIEEYERARRVWTYALQIAPSDPDIPKYMARLPEPSR